MDTKNIKVYESTTPNRRKVKLNFLREIVQNGFRPDQYYWSESKQTFVGRAKVKASYQNDVD